MQKMSVEPSALGNVCSLIHSDIYKNDIYVTHSGSDQHDRKIKRCTSVVCDTVREITSDAFILYRCSQSPVSCQPYIVFL